MNILKDSYYSVSLAVRLVVNLDFVGNCVEVVPVGTYRDVMAVFLLALYYCVWTSNSSFSEMV